MAVFIHIVFQLVHKPLSDPLELLVPGIVAGPVKGEEREHAGIPIPNPVPFFSGDFVLDIKAPAGRTEVGAGSAVDARKRDSLPERGVEKLIDRFLPEVIHVHPGGDFFLRCSGKASDKQ